MNFLAVKKWRKNPVEKSVDSNNSHKSKANISWKKYRRFRPFGKEYMQKWHTILTFDEVRLSIRFRLMLKKELRLKKRLYNLTKDPIYGEIIN